MSASFERFKVKPSGWGAGHMTVLVWPRMGFWEALWSIFEASITSYDPVIQREFIEAAIREKLEREKGTP